VARLVLVGLPGVGKTTLASELAQHWNCLALDTDELLSLNVGTAAAQYLREHGEDEFRVEELKVLHNALECDAVVATGAGVVVTSNARALLRSSLTVWLDCDDELLVARVEDGDRPLLGDDHVRALRKLRDEREPWYNECATWRVDASRSPTDVLCDVVKLVSRVSP
jgi:shikimate kinase